MTLKLMSLSLVFLSGAAAFAGPSSSGGGPSIVCRDPKGVLSSAQLLDLYEGGIRYGLKISKSSVPAQTQLLAAFEKLEQYNWFIASDVKNALQEVEKKIAFLPAGVIMAPGVDLGDSYAALIPDGPCEIAYVGYYEDDGTLRIAKDIYDLLSETDRAALFMHEALYKVSRDIGQLKLSTHNSLAARVFNGYLFSDSKNLSTLDKYSSELTWTGVAEYVHRETLPAVKITDNEYSLVLHVTTHADRDEGRIWVACYQPGVFEPTALYWNHDDFIQGKKDIAIQVPKDCELIHFSATSSAMNIEVSTSHGRQLASFTLDYSGELMAMLPIYLDRDLDQ